MGFAGARVRKRIAIVSMSVGWGHVRVADVIHRALSDGGDAAVDVRIADANELGRSWFRWIYFTPYWWMLRHAPGLLRCLFEHRQRGRRRSTAPAWLFRRGCIEVLRQLKAFSPQLVIATEIGAAEIAALGRREGWFSAPILAVQTEFHTEPPWVQREIDIYCVASDEAKAQLISWGVLPNRVLLSGIPIDPAFALAFHRPELHRALGLDSRRPVVLVMGGGMRPAPLDEIVRALEVCGSPLQVLAVTGHDGPMRSRLESLRGRIALDLHIFGWSETIPELMAAADVLITKPGGATAAEAMAMGLPMILTHPVLGREERHVRFLEKNGVAILAPGLEDIPRLMGRLLARPENLKEMARRGREIARPGAAHAIAQVARALFETSTYIDLLAVPPPRPGDSAYLM